jgi:hypothetical protein
LASNVSPTGTIAADGTYVWFIDRGIGGGSSVRRVPTAGGPIDGFAGCSCNFVQLRVDAQNYYVRGTNATDPVTRKTSRFRR